MLCLREPPNYTNGVARNALRRAWLEACLYWTKSGNTTRSIHAQPPATST
jgi:hypothetical protein